MEEIENYNGSFKRSEMEDQDSAFIKQATEAIVDISLDINNIDPIIKELLQRVKNTRNTSRHRKRPVASTENGIKTGTHNGNVKVKKEDVGQGLTKPNESKSQDRRNSNGGKQFRCAKCSLEFSRSSDLRRHEKTHFAILPNICPQCGKGFARKDALKRHYDTLTCRRNRSKLLSAGGEGINELLKKVKQSNIANREESNKNNGWKG